MISICMAVKNGELFIKEQLESILPQLAGNDELIISDDNSNDATVGIIESFGDQRIKVLKNPEAGILSNFQNALQFASGDKIFLADQDDVWIANKIQRMSPLLDQYEAVVCDCAIVDERLKPEPLSFFEVNKSNKGILKNIMRNSYIGCCMAFNRTLLDRILPFPKNIPMHDLWIGLIAELHFTVFFLPEKLVLYRRHNNNATTTLNKSSRSIITRMSSRYHLIKNLIRTTYA
ncbi:MAG: glycosyltransferase family 2 protein [Cyclobacteriaceae bacterium]